MFRLAPSKLAAAKYQLFVANADAVENETGVALLTKTDSWLVPVSLSAMLLVWPLVVVPFAPSTNRTGPSSGPGRGWLGLNQMEASHLLKVLKPSAGLFVALALGAALPLPCAGTEEKSSAWP